MIIIGLDPVIQLQEQQHVNYYWQDKLSYSFSIYHSTQHKELSFESITNNKLSAAILDLKVKTRSNCQTDIKFEILDPKNHKTIYYTTILAKPLNNEFSRWPTAAILDFCQLRLMPTLLTGTTLPILLFNF